MTGEQRQPAAPAPSLFSDFVDLACGMFAAPARTLRELAQRPRAPFGAILLAYFIVVLINALAGAASARTGWQNLLELFRQLGSGAGPGVGSPAGAAVAPQSGGMVLAIVAVSLLAAPVGLFIKTGILGLSTALLGGQRPPARLLAAFALTYLPTLAVVPFTLLALGRPNQALVGTVVGLGVLVWRLILDIIAIREVGGLDIGRAVAAAIVPLVALFVVALLIVLFWLTGFMTLLQPMLQSGVPGAG